VIARGGKHISVKDGDVPEDFLCVFWLKSLLLSLNTKNGHSKVWLQ